MLQFMTGFWKLVLPTTVPTTTRDSWFIVIPSSKNSGFGMRFTVFDWFSKYLVKLLRLWWVRSATIWMLCAISIIIVAIYSPINPLLIVNSKQLPELQFQRRWRKSNSNSLSYHPIYVHTFTISYGHLYITEKGQLAFHLFASFRTEVVTFFSHR